MDPSEQERDIANARLIAAAPETADERDRLKAERDQLLEALQSIGAFIRSPESYEMNGTTMRARVTSIAIAAIAAATGGDQ